MIQFDKEKIKEHLEARNEKAKSKFKHKMCLLFGEDLYKEKIRHTGTFNKKWDN
ncbi:MAG: hypothetical protein ACN2B6_01260 [Rickettsiales bacterium]